MPKYYFYNSDSEMCYSLKSIKKFMLENRVSEKVVFKADIDYNTDYFFCREFQEVGEVNNGCGKECHKYKPRNGISGRCRFSANTYSPGEEILINI